MICPYISGNLHTSKTHILHIDTSLCHSYTICITPTIFSTCMTVHTCHALVFLTLAAEVPLQLPLLRHPREAGPLGWGGASEKKKQYPKAVLKGPPKRMTAPLIGFVEGTTLPMPFGGKAGFLSGCNVQLWLWQQLIPQTVATLCGGSRVVSTLNGEWSEGKSEADDIERLCACSSLWKEGHRKTAL